jgi:tetratricopeptide (TPR) repeat protein
MGIAVILPLLGLLWGAGNNPPEDVTFLRKVAQDLIRQGQPSKALVLLQRARAMDSLQLDIDKMMNQCRAKLGGWVAPDASSDWSEVDGQMDKALRAKPDSMFKVAQGLVETDDIAGALRILLLLSRSIAANPAYLKAYTDLQDRQETKVAFHRAQAEQAMLHGQVSEALAQWRLAFATKPDDIELQRSVEKADRACQLSLLNHQAGLQHCLLGRDDMCALDVLGKARVAHPDNQRFLKVEDSLKTHRKEFLSARLRQIEAQVDSGRERDAMESMESLVSTNPGEPSLFQAQQALQDRIDRRRREIALDSISRAFDIALRNGDVQGAEAMVEDLRSRKAGGERTDRLRQRIDSVRSRERNANAVGEAMVSSRRLLGKGDTAGAKVSLRKALSLQPENALAKGLLASLNASRPTVIAPKPKIDQPTTVGDDVQKRANDLVLAGVTAYRSGDYQAAMDKWKQAVVLDPNCVQAKRYLVNVGQKQARLQ